MSHQDIELYDIHTMLLFYFIFVLGDAAKMLLLHQTRRTEEAEGCSEFIRPSVHDYKNKTKQKKPKSRHNTRRVKKRDLDRARTAGKAMPHTCLMCGFGLIYHNYITV